MREKKSLTFKFKDNIIMQIQISLRNRCHGKMLPCKIRIWFLCMFFYM